MLALEQRHQQNYTVGKRRREAFNVEKHGGTKDFRAAREQDVISTHHRMSLTEGLINGLMKTRVSKELGSSVE